MAGEKTEQATPKRQEDERKKGNIFQSKEVVIVFSLLIMFYSIQVFGGNILGTLEKSVVDFFTLAQTTDLLLPSNIAKIFIDCCIVFATTALPLLLISACVSIIFTMAQTKLMFNMKSAAFKLNKLNPLKGLKNMISMKSLVELVKSILKISVLGYIIYDVIMSKAPLLPNLMDMEFKQIISFLGDMIMAIVFNVCIVFVFLAGFDYIYQKWEYDKSLKMSKQDIKEEYKQTEGDPQVKGKIKEKQRQQAMSRMMQSVPSADVVIKNPTHYAVALKYDADKNHAPIVVAKGADKLALRIIKVAEENNVIITENRPLARGLYESVELESEIPLEFYGAVAEVLAFVYNLKQRKE